MKSVAAPGAVVDSLYSDFLERGLRYFLPGCQLELAGPATRNRPTLDFQSRPDGTLELDWFGHRYIFHHPHGTFSENQIRLVGAIASVLSARHRSIFNAASSATSLQLFRGLPEDRFVSAYLDPYPYLDENVLPATEDYLADAIEVLRESSLLTYENRRISTGVLLFGPGHDADHEPPPAESGSLKYTSALTSIKSFHRLCDGLQTLFLVNRDGYLVNLIDIRDWSSTAPEAELPAPSSNAYRPHCLATLHGGHICMVLTPNGEIKIFADGAQAFSFLSGRWRLTDVVEKFHEWRQSIGEPKLAERLFSAALNLAEDRRGGLFVVLEDAELTRHFVSASDLLEEACLPRADAFEGAAKNQIHYLLRHKRVLELAPALLETIARMDGSIVVDRESNLLAFGAILRNGVAGTCNQQLLEGGRTTAAVNASHFASVLKISEDGLVSFYKSGQLVWEI